MLKPPLPSNEDARLQALRALGVLDSAPEEQFDRLTRLAQHILQVPIALVSLVDANRQWFKSHQGLDASETPRDISFCGHAILEPEILLIPDAALDPRFSDNPLVTAAPNIRFYAGAPLSLGNGLRVGTLCAIDSQPHQVSAAQLDALRDLAQCVSEELERVRHRQSTAESALIQAKYAAIIASSDDAILSTELDDFISSWNPAAEGLLGYTAKEAIGRHMSIAIPPERADEQSQVLPRLRRGERIEPFETIRLRKDGTRIDVSVSISPVLDTFGRIIGVSKIVRDISAQKQAKKALRESTQLVNSIVETVVDGIITIDSHGKILSFNNAAQRMFGYEQFEAIGAYAKTLMPEPYAAEHVSFLAHYRQTKVARGVGLARESLGQRKDGSTFPIELTVCEMQQPGDSLFVGIVRDLTERKQIERMKGEFVSTVSHELRTPLTSIRGALGLILGKFSDGLPAKARQLLETANRNSDRLTLLINDILDLEKIQSGQLDFEFKALDLLATAQQAIAANEGYGQHHGVSLRLVESPPSAFVWADAHRLLQVFSNLISNAVKYSPAGGTVEVKVRRRDGHFRVSVRDYGRGIPQEFRSRIFQRFAQADSSDTREKGGTGLGLSITKAIIERHGGSIDFVSEAGTGTTFFFDLKEWSDIVAMDQPLPDRPRMLICEDSPQVAKVLCDMLEHEGVSSDSVRTADAALEMLRRKVYSGLLLDLDLPGMDGLNLIQKLRSLDATRELPVIVLTGRPQTTTDLWHCTAVTVFAWLEKPVDRHELARALQQARRHRKRPHILHVEDDLDIIQITQALIDGDADYTYATTMAAARRELAQNHCDLLLLDVTLPDGCGLDLLSTVGADTKVIVFSGLNSNAALKQQVAAALNKGTTSNDQLLAAIKQAIYPNER